MRSPLLLLALLLLPASAWGKPSWAQEDDRADERGHLFVCEGQGASEEDALAAAHGVCNDKICKVCGVEIESVVQTRETLKGVELERKVVERCRRVRKQETRVRYKSTDCGPDGCTTWIQVLYSRDDEKAECPGYASEKFSDPAACEGDINRFRATHGRHAAELRARESLLEAALADCAQIDVRPTPAIMALDEKLRAGLAGRFPASQPSGESRHFRDAADRFLAPYAPLSQQIKETKKLVDRIGLVRDYLHDRAFVLDVVEAYDAPGFDTPEGITRTLAAIGRAPRGASFDTPDIHFWYVRVFEDARHDRDAYGAWVRKTYAPAEIPPDSQPAVSSYFRGDGRVTAAEWAYARAMFPEKKCVHCLRFLLAVAGHEPAAARLDRLVEAWKDATSAERDEKRRRKLFMDLVPLGDAVFTLDIEARLPPELAGYYGLELYDALLERVDFPPVRAEGRVLARRIGAELLRAPVTADGCRSLVRREKSFTRYGVSPADFDGRVCQCLEGPLANETVSDSDKSELYERALAQELPCVR